jgi:hypothetical protein
MAMAMATALPAVMLAQAAPAPPAAPGQGAPAGQRGAGPGGPPGGGGRGGAATGRSAAPVDLTGYWVSIVTEDWIERMSPESPPSGVANAGPGGFGGGGGRGGRGGGGAPVPVNPDPCRVYGAGGSMRVPGRLHITWADDNTLKTDMSAGTQTRLFRFNVQQPQPGPPSLQGYSVATWEGVGRGGGGFGGFGGGGGGGRGAAAPPRWGSLKVVTTNTTGGYLLSSRSHYSPNAVLTEHFTRHTDFGVEYFTVTAIIEDGGQTRITSSTFKKEPDGSKFAPAGCELAP